MELSNIINIENIEYAPHQHGQQFEARLGAVGAHLGARKLGYNVTIVPPGKKAWPYHRHHANEEMFFILEGEGLLRLDGEEFSVRVGDFIATPAGPKHAHQLINNSQSPLKFLAVSTMEQPEVVEYPDSDKIGMLAGSAPGDSKGRRDIMFIAREQSGVDYWDGED